MKWLAALFAALLLLLQYRVWLSTDGIREVLRLKQAVAQQQATNALLLERNRQLAAEVRDLKQGYAALEERARSDLGMIAGNETFYQVVPPSSAAPASMPPSSVPPVYRQPSAAAAGASPLAAATAAQTQAPDGAVRDALPREASPPSSHPLTQRGAAARE